MQDQKQSKSSPKFFFFAGNSLRSILGPLVERWSACFIVVSLAQGEQVSGRASTRRSCIHQSEWNSTSAVPSGQELTSAAEGILPPEISKIVTPVNTDLYLKNLDFLRFRTQKMLMAFESRIYYNTAFIFVVCRRFLLGNKSKWQYNKRTVSLKMPLYTQTRRHNRCLLQTRD